ncbi:hypothetical protein HYT55_04740 [Candidatus Woesearchaeota archaeon]|nr:hypothetical protein [Candidatus Woesearchaeota archaeon]
MAQIGIENISEIRLNVIPVERRFDSTGDLAVHPVVAARYLEGRYDQKPQNEDEARVRGEKGFNGMMSSLPRISVYDDGGRKLVVADVAPTRYLLGQALRDVVKESDDFETARLSASHGFLTVGDEVMRERKVFGSFAVHGLSPDMANISLVVPVKMGGHYFLMSQVKGKALGSGEVHTGLVAGNIDGKYLREADPFVAALQAECSEEAGVDLSSLDRTAALYMVDERETGQVNFAYLARAADAQQMLHTYDQTVREKLAKGEALEVMALTAVPFGSRLEPLDGGALGLKGITTYHPTVNGLVEKVEDRKVRPYTQATLDYLAKPENVRFLLEKAGF